MKTRFNWHTADNAEKPRAIVFDDDGAEVAVFYLSVFPKAIAERMAESAAQLLNSLPPPSEPSKWLLCPNRNCAVRAILREVDKSGIRQCPKCKGPVDANPSSVPRLDVRTTSGEIFTGEDSARLAALILRRFGGEIEIAASVWRRMLGNNCSDTQFADLAKKGKT